MLEDGIAKHPVHILPVARDQTLLVQVDEVALDHFIRIPSLHLGDAILQTIPNLIALDFLERVAKGLEFLDSLFSQKLFDSIGKQVDILV